MAEQESPSRRRSNAPLIIAIVMALLGLILVCLFAYFILSGSTNVPQIVPPSEATPTSFSAPQPTVALSDEWGVVQVGDANTATLKIDSPNFLHVGDNVFGIQRDDVGEDGMWAPAASSNSQTTAVWVNGTIVNYVLALADTTQNREILDGLVIGDELKLTTASGQERKFSFNERGNVPTSNRDVFMQTSPGITILIVNIDGPDRMMVRGDYVEAEAAPSINPQVDFETESVIRFDEPAVLGDVEVRVNSFDQQAQPGGTFAYYLVDYEVSNVSAQAFETTALKFTLKDDAGNQYTLNPEAGLLGNFPPLGASVGSGQRVGATVGYQIPAALDPMALGWVVERLDTGAIVEVRRSLPVDEDALSNLRVTLAQAKFTPDGANNLVLRGQISNDSSQTIMIAESDILLVGGSGAVYQAVVSNPGTFPWTVAAGQSLDYTLEFPRTSESDVTATFSILNYKFELTGLR